jgi:3'-phosphoadenosine 5'-phosphosulfate sulfotransferase (PAPS reductase)/FAD synthetase
MCILYGKAATAIWADTGWEQEKMYERIDQVEAQLKNYHGGDFSIIRIKPSVKARDKVVNTLQDYIKEYSFMPSKQHRYCTRLFKIEPIDEFLSSQGECELMIGLNADEENEREGNWGLSPNVKYTYPLIEAGYSREMCEDILHLHGLHPNFPPYMQRGGCVGCIFKSVAELKAMYYFSKEEFEKTKQLEEGIQDQRKKFFTLSMSQRSFQDIEDECKREISLWGEEKIKDMYQKVKGAQSCGPFCHR